MKKCGICGSTIALTKHHVNGNAKGVVEYLCIVHHAKLHGASEESFERRYKRLEKRITQNLENLVRLQQYLGLSSCQSKLLKKAIENVEMKA